MTDLARETVRRWERLKADRSPQESLWQEIAELTWPQAADFTVQRPEGQKRGLQQYDATAATSLNEFASGMWGNLTNSAVDWLQLRHPDDDMNDDAGVKTWMDAARVKMQNALAAKGAGFYTSVLSTYKGLGSFGTAVLFVDEQPEGGRLRFSARALAECCIDQNDQEIVDTVLRRFRFTARQAVARWGDAAPEKARKAVADGKPDDPFWFLQAVMPNDKRDPRKRDARGKAWQSLHICMDSMSVVQSGGYAEFPFMVPRWGTTQRGLYGESPAMAALADIKVLNTIERTKLVAGQKAADPPLLVGDENDLRGVKVHPGGITYGGVDSDGRPRVVPLQTGANFNVFEGMAEQKREVIRTALHNTVLMMQTRANATATEVLEVKEERLRLLGPQLARIEQELLEPTADRVFALMWRAEAFDPLPPALEQDPRIQVEYVSQLSVAQKSGQAAAVLRGVQNVMQMAQARPDVLDNVDWDEATRRVMDGYGAPPAILRDPRAVAAEREQRAQQAEQMQQAQMMAGAAGPAKDFAGAMKTMVDAEAAAGQGAPA